MFEQLPSLRIHRLEPREAILAALSILCHTAGLGSILAATWLTLAPLPLPSIRPQLVAPVLFFRPWAPAPAKGGGEAVPTPAVAARLASPPPEVIQPQSPPPVADTPAVETPAGREDAAPSGPGAPDGISGADPRGIPGGICLGEDCDPAGAPGGGSGGGVASDSPEIRIPGTNGVTEPVIIESSRVLPRYPELARRAGMTGRVILHAVISPEGSVGSVQILTENPPQLGFGPAAVEAVSHWRYLPATLMGRPVAVQFTIIVEFTLSR